MAKRIIIGDSPVRISGKTEYLVLMFLSLCLFVGGTGGCDRIDDSATEAQLPSSSSEPPTRSTKDATPHNRVSESADEYDAQSNLIRIVAFGNSLTSGLGVPSSDAYPAQLQRRFDLAGYQTHVINAGVSGETSAGGLRRVEWILKSRPDLVILELGGNDGLRGFSPDQTRSNLANIIRRFKEKDVDIVLAGMKMPPNLGKEYTEQFAGIYPTLATTFQIPLIPFFLEGVATNRTLMQPDGIHPTSEGYRIIVDNLFPLLETTVKEHVERGTPIKTTR